MKNGAILTVACVMLCLTFNYTFPLRRESSKWNIFANHNESQHYCDKRHHENIIVDPTKKTATYTENALKIVKDASNTNEKQKSKKQAKCPVTKNTDDDLRHFEQMVIKKKNPYLDLKELELKYYNPKNTRQVDPGSIGQDPSLCEALEDGPNVEITNRGLSGFAVPSKLLKGSSVAESKVKLENSPSNDISIKTIAKISKEQSDHSNIDHQLLSTLEDDIRRFEEGETEIIISS